MRTNTKSLFISVLKAQHADGVFDIGSRDGDQSLLFRHLLPAARVTAFEANPINFEAMKADPRLKTARIDLFPYAISDRRGAADFHVADVDYEDPHANRGISSLLLSPEQNIRTTVQVQTHRIDEFVLEHCSELRRIGLWIDVEGAEYAVLSGLDAVRGKILAVHVETANSALRAGQRTLHEIVPLMLQHGFRLCGRNFGPGESEWGDVVFLPESLVAEMGLRFQICKLKAFASYFLRADQIAAALRGRAPALYRFLRRCYIRFGT